MMNPVNPFFETSAVNLVAISADLYCIYIAAMVSLSLRVHLRFMRYAPTAIYTSQPRVLAKIALPRIEAPTTIAFQLILIGALLSASFSSGLISRVSLLIALISYFFAFARVAHLETNARKTYLIPIFIFIFLISPGVSASWDSSGSYWPIWAMKLALCQIYVSGAVQKIKNHGRDWVANSSLSIYLLRLDLYEDNRKARYVATKPLLVKLIAYSTLALQLTFWTILIWPTLLPIYISGGLLFHFGTAWLMRIYYVKYITAAYLILAVDWLFWQFPEALIGVL